MKNSRKRILSLLFAVILMLTNVGDLQLFASAAGDRAAAEVRADAGEAYRIVGKADEIHRRTYVFYVPQDNNHLNDYGTYRPYGFSTGLKPVELDDSSIVVEQTVAGDRNGENPGMPVLPRLSAAAEQIFDGWYAGEDDGGTWAVDESNPYDFGGKIEEKHEIVYLFARYHPFAYVVFHDSAEEDSPIAYIRRVELNSVGDILQGTLEIDEELSVDYRGRYRLVGWKQLGTTDTPTTITVGPGRTDLYPVFQRFAWLDFVTTAAGTGATYVPSQAVSGSGIQGPLPVPAYSGYDFTGWYAGTTQVTNAQGELVGTGDSENFLIAGNTLVPNNDLTLYAHWSRKTTADYLVVVWTQKTTDAQGLDYDYYESRTLHGQVGQQGSGQTSFTEYRQQLKDAMNASGFDGDHPHIDAASIAADGSTVVNVYYDCKEFYDAPAGTYTLSFADSAAPATFDAALVPPAEGLAYGESILAILNNTTPPAREGYTFTGWYVDPACRILAKPAAGEGQLSANLTAMPGRDLTLYAGWELEWYLVQIDPNYGALYSYDYAADGSYLLDGDGNRKMSGTGSTWMWKTRESDLLQEYTHVTRDFVESSTGEWYYVNHNYAYYGDNPPSDADRKTYYTMDASEATSFETYEKAPSVYSYADWYEVLPDGTETPYDFTRHVTRDMTLRLHWKEAGNYYIEYRPEVVQDGVTLQGTLDSGGTSEALFRELEQAKYADNAEVLVLRCAEAPHNSGYIFKGWSIGGDKSKLYGPGDVFSLHSDLAVRVNGKNTVYLDAVYDVLPAAKIVYDAGGGTVSEPEGDDGYGLWGGYSLSAYVSADNFPSTPVREHDETSATLSNLVNNSVVTLSMGEGFTGKDGAALVGWCASPNYDPDDAAYPLYGKGEDFIVDSDGEEPTTLYAVWGVNVTYRLLEAGATAAWDTSVYVPGANNSYTQAAFAGSVLAEPEPVPESNDPSKVFYCWTTEAGNLNKAFDFSQPIPGALELYAYWAAPGTVPVRAAWKNADGVKCFDGPSSLPTIQAGTNEVTPASQLSFVQGEYRVEESTYGYDIAVIGTEEQLAYVTEEDAVQSVYYDRESEKVWVRFADPGREDVPLKAGECLWFLFYKKKTLDIAYVGASVDGGLTPVYEPQASELMRTSELGEFDASAFALPSVNSEWGYFSFALGPAYVAEGEGKTAISDLQLFSAPVPTTGGQARFWVRNSWQGIQCSMDEENWISCGYQPQLYVVWFQYQPTLIRLWETTYATRELIGKTAFEYSAEIGNPDGSAGQSFSFTLKSGESKTIIAYHWTDDSGRHAQTVNVTQSLKDEFVTRLTGGGTSEQTFTFTASDGVWTKTGSFSNYHRSQTVEVHVAVMADGEVSLRDGLRGDDYTLTVPLAALADSGGKDVAFLDELAPKRLIGDAAAAADYTFSAVVYGDADDEGRVAVESLDVSSVSYARRERTNVYELLLKDGAGAELAELGSSKVFYLYFKMPAIRYMKDDGSGTLSEIGNAGGIITNRGQTVTLNGMKVVKNQIVPVSGAGLLISQEPGSANFHLPQELDDFQDGHLYQRYLRLDRVGVGSGDGAELRCSDDLTLRLRIASGRLQYRLNGGDWTDMTETPAIYAIYTVQGYELAVTKTVDMEESGEDAAFTDADFTLTVRSEQLQDGKEYAVEGGYADSVKAAGGSLVLRIRHGDTVRIKGLAHGSYTISESDNESYTAQIKVKENAIPLGAEGYPLMLDSPMKAAIFNKPAPICEIVDAGGIAHSFYTLKSAVAYAKTSSAAGAEVTITMLTDYVMPAADAPVIDAGLNIVLTGNKTITRGAGLDGAMFTNRGSLTLRSLILDGAKRLSSGPMILQTAGSLTVGDGAVLKGAASSGNGGAIRAERGDVTVTAGALIGGERTEEEPVNRAANGGAIAFGGSGTLAVSGGAIKGNDASGDGGAIWATGGTISISNASLSDNRAAGNGGAIYGGGSGGTAIVSVGENAVISDNRAANGSAVFVNAGSASFFGENNGASVTGNTTAGEGGAVAVGSDTVQLSFKGKANIKNNKKGDGAEANVWLDRDSDMVIFDNGVKSGAEIGIYVPDTEVLDSTGNEVTLFSLRGNVGTYFGSYAGSGGANVGCFKNDRQDVTAVKDEKKEKILWGKAVQVEVRLLKLDTAYPDKPISEKSIKTFNTVYPQSGWAMSQLAEDLYTRYQNDLKTLPVNSAFAYAFKDGLADAYGDYLTEMKWEDDQWKVKKRNGEWISLKTGNKQKKLILYFAEPARITVENNTDWLLEISGFIAGRRNVVNVPGGENGSAGTTGYGQVIAINGTIQTVRPVESSSLPDEAGSSVFVNEAGTLCIRPHTTFQLWIPNLFGLDYAFAYSFPSVDGTVRLLRTGDTEEQSVSTNGSLSGSLLNDPTQNYEIKFGGNRDICRITTKNDEKHTYPSILAAIQNAMAAAEDGGLAEKVTDASTGRKVFTVEMLTDYMIPASDTSTTALDITGCDITLTTAPELGRRATISRDQGNPNSFLNLKGKASTAAAERTSLTITDLNFDGKNLRGSTNGGGIVTEDIHFCIRNCDFTRFVANSGGALFAMYTPNFAGYNSADDTLCVMEVYDSTFSNCISKTVNSSSFSLHGKFTARQGGGAIWAEARKLVLSGCSFDNCKAEADTLNGGAQGGAVFHRIDGEGADVMLKHVYYAVSESDLSFCTFTNCEAEAGGGLELDAYNAVVTGCTVSSCTSTKRNGGGMNYWIETGGNGCTGGKLTVKGCLFENCKASKGQSNGGAIRSTALTNEISDCVIRDSECSNTGGGVSLTNTNRNALSTLTHVSISGCKAKYDGGGIYSVGKLTLVGGGATFEPTDGSYPAEVCSLPYGSFITGNEATDRRGGGVYAAKDVILSDGVMITGNRLGLGGSADVNNAAGLYFGGSKLTVGRIADGDNNLPDATTIDENYTSAGVRSNLRLPESEGENSNCVTVNRSLSGKIYVVNAKARDTQFGTGSRAYAGLNDMNPAFRADDGSLWGIIQLTDTAGTNLIWAGPHLCKITDENNNLLFFKIGDSSVPCPAVFDVLDDGSNSPGYTSAFALLRFSKTDCKFCYKDGNPYRTTDQAKSVFKVKMLTDSCALTTPIETAVDNAAWQQIWLTTETERKAREEDPFPYHGEEGIPLCTISKSGSGCERLIKVHLGMRLENIVLDGMNYSTGSVGALCLVENSEAALLVLGQNAVLQNGMTTNEGGGVYVRQGKLSIVDGGVIRNCTATKDGGGVYIKYGTDDATDNYSKAKLELSYGSINDCKASGKGGGVHVEYGSFVMTGGMIQGCTSVDIGGGVMVNNKSSMTMTGGSIRGNRSTGKPAEQAGGGVSLGSLDGRLYFSGKPIISGNMDSAGTTANVVLNYDSNAIINVSGSGLVSGARVGVYVPDIDENEINIYDKHGKKNCPFGTHETTVNTKYLYGFVNDRNGYRGGKKKDVTDELIYWVEVYALEVAKEVSGLPEYEEGAARTGPANLDFRFRVRMYDYGTLGNDENALNVLRENILGDVDPANVTITKDNNSTVLEFALKHDQSIMIMNLPKGISYVVEELTDTETADGKIQYAPQQASISGVIGGKDGTRMISTVRVVNTQYVCKVTDGSRLLYESGGTKGRPAVYTRLVDALDALGSLKTEANKDDPESAPYSGSYHIEMLVPEYTVEEAEVTEVTIVGGKEVSRTRLLTDDVEDEVTLTTASVFAEDGYPYRGEASSPAVIFRGYDGGSLLTVETGAKLTLTNIILDGNSEIHTADADGGLVCVHAKGTLNIRDGATLRNSAAGGNGGAVAAESGGLGGMIVGIVEMSGGTVTNCSGEDGGAFYLAGGSKLWLSGGTVTGNSASGDGGAVSLAEGGSTAGTKTDLLVTDGAIRDNTASGDGGAFYLAANTTLSLSGGELVNNSGAKGGAVYSAGSVAMSGGKITNNHSTADGGAFYLNAGSSLTLTAGEISSNISGRDGGAVYLAAGVSAEISGGTVKNNTASVDGGAFYLAPGSSLSLSGGEASGNGAANGGAVYNKGSVTMSGGKITNNRSTFDGGAVYLNAGSSLTLTDGEISDNGGGRNGGAVFSKGNVTLSGDASKRGSLKNNLATGDGGAAYLASGSFTLTAGEVSGNRAVNGGAVYVSAGVSVEMTTGEIKSNTATGDGGAFYLAAGSGDAKATLSLSGGEVSGNSASGSGGAVYSLGSVTLGGSEEAHAAITGSRAEVDGGAVYVAAGSFIMNAGEISNNVSGRDGGAVYLAAGISVEMTTGAVTDNTAGADGGAFALAAADGDAKASLTLSGGTVTGNSASGNGGAVSLASGSTLTLSGGTVTGNSASGNGGAVSLASGSTLALSGGTITGNTIKADSPDGQGAGIYLSAESLLTLSGAPDFGGAETADGAVAAGGNRNLRTGLLVSGDANGRQSYTAARQDIYLSEKPGEKPATLHVTASFTAPGEDLKAAEGSVWVWAEYEDHRKMRKPFAVMDGEVSEEVGKLFRNAQTNARSLCSGEYLYGCPGDFSGTPSDPYLYWSGGIDVYFKKVDSYETDRRDAAGYPLGQQLAGAEFALYMTYDEALKGAPGDSNSVEVTMQDGSTARSFVSAGEYAVADKIKLKGSVVTAYQYNVTFSVVPGVYYMKEIQAPAGYRPNPFVYKVYVGESNVPEEYGDSDYLILRMPNAKKEDADPDILKYGIVNLPEAERKVILKNADKAWQPLTGGTFDILFWDLSPYWYYVKDGEGNRLVNTQDFGDGAFTAGAAGAFWTGRLPFGTYYLRKAGDPQKWYKLTVKEGDRQVLEVIELTAAPG
jgi:uncharacterized repeat protein (TIGR02543 family)